MTKLKFYGWRCSNLIGCCYEAEDFGFSYQGEFEKKRNHAAKIGDG